MNKLHIAAASIVLASLSSPVFSQVKIPSILKQLPGNSSGELSLDEIGSGIKEALEKGITNSTSRLTGVNGFLNNPAVKIVFPSEALRAEKTLRGLGFNDLCDNVITSLNRAAEDAAKEALPIFSTAIKQMNVKDAKAILLSEQNDAATSYFKTATTSQLTEKFKPIIQASLDKAGATKFWTAATSQYNKLPLTSDVNTDLNDYVTQKALAGLFHEVALEELKIRENSSFRTSPLLKKVFAYADQKK